MEFVGADDDLAPLFDHATDILWIAPRGLRGVDVGRVDDLHDLRRQLFLPDLWVVVLPPPLMADDGDVVRVVRLLVKLDDRTGGEHADAGQQRSRHRAPEQLELRVAVDLFRDVVLAFAAELDEAEDHERVDEHAHRYGDGEHRLREPGDVACRRALGLERVLRSMRAPTQRESGKGD